MLRIPDAPPWRTSERVVENRSLGEVSCGHRRGFHGTRGTRSVPVRALCLFVLCFSRSQNAFPSERFSTTRLSARLLCVTAVNNDNLVRIKIFKMIPQSSGINLFVSADDLFICKAWMRHDWSLLHKCRFILTF